MWEKAQHTIKKHGTLKLQHLANDQAQKVKSLVRFYSVFTGYLKNSNGDWKERRIGRNLHFKKIALSQKVHVNFYTQTFDEIPFFRLLQ